MNSFPGLQNSILCCIRSRGRVPNLRATSARSDLWRACEVEGIHTYNEGMQLECSVFGRSMLKMGFRMGNFLLWRNSWMDSCEQVINKKKVSRRLQFSSSESDVRLGLARLLELNSIEGKWLPTYLRYGTLTFTTLWSTPSGWCGIRGSHWESPHERSL